jgi:hypothetical protein
MRTVRVHPAISSLASVVATVSVSFLAGIGASLYFSAPPIVTSAIVVMVVAALFAVRVAEGIAAFGIVVLLAETVQWWASIELRYLDELSVPAIAVVMLVVHRRRIALPSVGLREGAAVIVVAAAVLSSVANGVPAAIWLPGLILLAKAIVLFYLLVSLPMTHAELYRLCGAFLAIALAILAIGGLQFVAPELARGLFNLPPVAQPRGSIEVVNSLFTHPAIYGWLAAFVCLFLSARFAITRERWAIVLATIVGIGTVLSGRRTPIVSLVVSLGVGVARLALAGLAKPRILVPFGIAGLVVLLVAIPTLGDFYRGTLAEYGVTPEVVAEALSDSPERDALSSLPPRVGLALGSIAIARDEFPLGAGVGRFGSHMSRERYSPLYEKYGLDGIYGLSEAFPIAITDNFWPMVLAETGAIGLVAMIVFVASIGFELWRQAGTRRDALVSTLALGALLVFAEALTRSLTAAVFVAPPIASIVLGTVAVSLAISRRDAQAATTGSVG